MTDRWPILRLRDVLELQRRWFTPEPEKLYVEIGIRSFGKGVFHKTPVAGLDLGQKRVLHIHPGDLVFNNVFAWEGAVAVAGEAEKGLIGSHRFVTFTPRNDACDARYLQLYFQAEEGLQITRRASPGSAGRNRTLGIQRFLDQSIPLPPLSEQQQIVAKIEHLTAKIEEASGLREQSSTETDALLQSGMHSVWSDQDNWDRARVGGLIDTVTGQVDPRQEPYASLPHINGECMEARTGRLLHNYRTAREDGVKSGKYHFPEGAVLYSKIRPYLRKAVVVPFEGVCSADVYAIESMDPRIVPGFLKYALIGPGFTQYANERSGRTRMPKLNQKQLFAYVMAFPTLPKQNRIVQYLDGLLEEVGKVKAIQDKTAVELDALLPSILDRAFKGDL